MAADLLMFHDVPNRKQELPAREQAPVVTWTSDCSVKS